MISRTFTWVRDDEERSDQDERRAEALARRWSELQTQIENESFEAQWRREEGNDYEPPECETCGGRGVCGIEHPTSWRASSVVLASAFSDCCHCHGQPFIELIGITCGDCNGDGYDKSGERAKAARDSDRNLEIELLEDKLAAIGARMMRPYEHWNEDERIMEYMERER